MTREEKIAAITTICAAANPDDSHIQSVVKLRHIVVAFRRNKINYTLGAQGYFLNPRTLTATHARWDVFQNDLRRQSEVCVNFLYEEFTET